MNTRSNSDNNLFEIDFEIERTLHTLNRTNRLGETITSGIGVIPEVVFDSTNTSDTVSEFEIELDMARNNRTLKELAAPDVTYQPLGIQYPDTNMPFELKSGLIHLLPKFHGLVGEDPHKHLKEFHIVCSTMRPQGIQEEHIKLRAFPFSLADAAKDWLYYLQPGVVTCWNDMKKLFLEKFFPASRTASMRKEICGIRQKSGETLHEYWERFKRLCASYPHHKISD
jgi:hypothetical protein